MKGDCVRLVDAYSKEIIEMLVADLKPDEVCVALKLCVPKSSNESKFSFDLTNYRVANSFCTIFGFSYLIVDFTIGEAPKGITVGEFLDSIKQIPAEPSQKIASTNTPMCVMCEYAMSILEKRLITNSTEVLCFTSFFCFKYLYQLISFIRRRLQELFSFCALIYHLLSPTCALILLNNTGTSFSSY